MIHGFNPVTSPIPTGIVDNLLFFEFVDACDSNEVRSGEFKF